MKIDREIVAVALVLAVSNVAVGQSGSVDLADLHVHVQPTASFLAGNMTRITYVVANTQRSERPLFEFTVHSPVRVWRLEIPGPATRYLRATEEAGTHVVSWSWLDGMPRPGESSPILVYEAIGLPGIVSYRALQYYGVRDVPTTDRTVSGELRFDASGIDHVVGKTVGVDTLPLDLRPVALTKRLRALVDEACALGWITSAATCHSMRQNSRPVPHALRILHRSLVAQRGETVTEAAFALLLPNVEFVLAKL